MKCHGHGEMMEKWLSFLCRCANDDDPLDFLHFWGQNLLFMDWLSSLFFLAVRFCMHD